MKEVQMLRTRFQIDEHWNEEDLILGEQEFDRWDSIHHALSEILHQVEQLYPVEEEEGVPF